MSSLYLSLSLSYVSIVFSRGEASEREGCVVLWLFLFFFSIFRKLFLFLAVFLSYFFNTFIVIIEACLSSFAESLRPLSAGVVAWPNKI